MHRGLVSIVRVRHEATIKCERQMDNLGIKWTFRDLCNKNSHMFQKICRSVLMTKCVSLKYILYLDEVYRQMCLCVLNTFYISDKSPYVVITLELAKQNKMPVSVSASWLILHSHRFVFKLLINILKQLSIIYSPLCYALNSLPIFKLMNKTTVSCYSSFFPGNVVP